MLKRMTMAMVLVLSVVMMMSAAFAEEDCDHSEDTKETYVVTDATCTEQGYTTYTCSVCGETYVSDYTDATGHSYTSEVTTEATCTEDGVTTYTCSVCGDTYTEAISATGHSYESEVTVEATCSEEGEITYTCSVCGDTYTETVETTDHTYDDGVVTEPTCTEGGYTTYTCEVCGETYTDDETSKLLHWYDEWTANEDGTHSAYCKRSDCDHEGTRDCETYTYTVNSVELTYCPICGEVTVYGTSEDEDDLELIDAEADSDDLPLGEIVLRSGELSDGTIIISVGFEYAGSLEQPEEEVTVTVDADLVEDYTVYLVNEDGTEEEVTVTVDDDEASFDLTFVDTDDEETPVVLLRLVAAA